MPDDENYTGRHRSGDGEYDIRDSFQEGRPDAGGSFRAPQQDQESPYAGAIGGLRALLEQQLRERPLPTLLLGVAAGWLAGKLLR
jgi:hypothetical protein